MGEARYLPVLASPIGLLWELRAAWATGRRVVLTIDGEPLGRVEGFVQRVAATDVFAVVNGLHVPTELILATHHPSRLGDSTAREGSFHGLARVVPQTEELFG